MNPRRQALALPLRAATTRPPVWRRVQLHLKRAMLLWNIDSTEQYMHACERDGIMDTATLRYWREHLQVERTRLAVVEAQLRGELAP